MLYRLLLKGVRHLFFLSELAMQESIEGKYIQKGKCSVPGWGADMNFFAQVPVTDNGYFVSTGKEQRDFDMLIEAFRRTGVPLKSLPAKVMRAITSKTSQNDAKTFLILR